MNDQIWEQVLAIMNDFKPLTILNSKFSTLNTAWPF